MPRTDRRRSRLTWADAFREAFAVIAQRPVRTMLTALGTILGVGAFVATTGLAQTARAQVSSRFDALKATEVRVQDGAPDGTNPFPADVDARLEALIGVRAAGLLFTLPDTPATRPRPTATRPLGPGGAGIPVIAATPGAVRATRPVLAAGRLLDPWYEARQERVALVGRAAAAQLGLTRIDSLPVVFLGDTPYTVIGIIDDVARNPDLLLGVVIPVSSAEALTDTRNTERQVLIDTDPGAAALVGHQAPLALRPQQPERLVALVPPDPTTLRNQVNDDIQSLFYALSGLALLIGTVAIANATLLNVVERRPEIGLRRALGATRRHITRQITLESALTGAVAGIAGTLVGLAAVTVTAITRRWTPTIDPATPLLAPLIGIATATLAGLLPARNAANVPPATTLRT